jgi:hypothetical protein
MAGTGIARDFFRNSLITQLLTLKLQNTQLLAPSCTANFLHFFSKRMRPSDPLYSQKLNTQGPTSRPWVQPTPTLPPWNSLAWSVAVDWESLWMEVWSCWGSQHLAIWFSLNLVCHIHVTA